jgi:hypothetical protein
MAKKKDKGTHKHYTENYRLSNMNPTKNGAPEG